MEFFYVIADNTLGEAGLLPFMPITIIHSQKRLNYFGLLDTGATVNVLPFSIGNELGLEWEEQSTQLNLSGNLSGFEAKAVILKSQISDFPEVRLAFAWTRPDNVPLILGQTNFFMEFDVCFFRSRLGFDVKPKIK